MSLKLICIKRSGRVLLGVMVAMLVVITAADDFYLPETMAVVWHVRHGFQAEMNGTRLKVPLMYYESHDSTMLELTLFTIPGRLNKKDAAISVDFHRQRPSSTVKEEWLKRWGARKSATHAIKMAGREGTCAEFVGGSAFPLGPYMVDCSFGDDLHAHFNGTENALPDFYQVLESAEAVKRKI